MDAVVKRRRNKVARRKARKANIMEDSRVEVTPDQIVYILGQKQIEIEMLKTRIRMLESELSSTFNPTAEAPTSDAIAAAPDA